MLLDQEIRLPSGARDHYIAENVQPLPEVKEIKDLAGAEEARRNMFSNEGEQILHTPILPSTKDPYYKSSAVWMKDLSSGLTSYNLDLLHGGMSNLYVLTENNQLQEPFKDAGKANLGSLLQAGALYDFALRGRLFVRIPGEEVPRQILADEKKPEATLSRPMEMIAMNAPEAVRPYNMFAAFFLRLFGLGSWVDERAAAAEEYQSNLVTFQAARVMNEKFFPHVADFYEDRNSSRLELDSLNSSNLSKGINSVSSIAKGEKEALENIQVKINEEHTIIQKAILKENQGLKKIQTKMNDACNEELQNNAAFLLTAEEKSALLLMAMANGKIAAQSKLGEDAKNLSPQEVHVISNENFREVLDALCSEEGQLNPQLLENCNNALNLALPKYDIDPMAKIIHIGLGHCTESCMKGTNISEKDLFLCDAMEKVIALMERTPELKSKFMEKQQAGNILKKAKNMVEMGKAHREGEKAAEELLSGKELSAEQKNEHIASFLAKDLIENELKTKNASTSERLKEINSLSKKDQDKLYSDIRHSTLGPVANKLGEENGLANLKAAVKQSVGYKQMIKLQPQNLISAMRDPQSHRMGEQQIQNISNQLSKANQGKQVQI
ncbi:MAG: hypothetical protein Q4B50_06450 [Bacillota bacterium]|nr:hypothetical protein [Bacillota bacterium]